jgi:hypothetical protein
MSSSNLDGMDSQSDAGVQFVALPDGRRIAYSEQGLRREAAERSLLVLHGLGCSRFAGMPGEPHFPWGSKLFFLIEKVLVF